MTMYQYATERPYVFTEGGQVQFLSIRDRCTRLINEAGAVTLGKAISGEVGSVWSMMACVDRLVELNYLREVPTTGAAQDRIFVRGVR
jgi:hypothetical protein